MNNLRMMIGEQEAIDKCIAYAELYGYGNIIEHLRQAWSKMLRERFNQKKETADMAAGIKRLKEELNISELKEHLEKSEKKNNKYRRLLEKHKIPF